MPDGAYIPDDSEILFTRVYRWPEAICLAPPGMFTAIRELNDGKRGTVKNLILAGDYTANMPSMNGALASGIVAAEKAMAMLP